MSSKREAGESAQETGLGENRAALSSVAPEVASSMIVTTLPSAGLATHMETKETVPQTKEITPNRLGPEAAPRQEGTTSNSGRLAAIEDASAGTKATSGDVPGRKEVLLVSKSTRTNATDGTSTLASNGDQSPTKTPSISTV